MLNQPCECQYLSLINNLGIVAFTAIFLYYFLLESGFQ